MNKKFEIFIMVLHNKWMENHRPKEYIWNEFSDEENYRNNEGNQKKNILSMAYNRLWKFLFVKYTIFNKEN